MEYIHHFVFGRKIRLDHWNRNKLDNRKGNLRPATRSQNAGNAKLRDFKTSRYRGVYFSKSSGKWVVQIGGIGRRESLGAFNDEDEAGKAYNKAAIAYFGEFAALNTVS